MSCPEWTVAFYYSVQYSMFGGAYGDARMPNWPPPHPLAQDRHYGPASKQMGECFGAGNLSALISPLILKCVDGATTPSLRFGIDQDLRSRR